MEECNLTVWNVFDQFGISIAYSEKYILAVGARILLEVATKGSIRGKIILEI